MQPAGGQQTGLPPQQPYPPYQQPYPSPYPPPYYYPLPPPPRRNNLVLVIVLVVILVILVPVIAAAVLYVMVSGLIGMPGPAPTVALGAVTQSAGNATIPVVYVSGSIDPASLEILLQADHSQTNAVGMPRSGTECDLVTTGGYVLCVYWADLDGNGLVNSGDLFRVTGEFAPLPPATLFDFYLLSPDRAKLAGVEWTTP